MSERIEEQAATKPGWGCRRAADGGARFGIWAPDCEAMLLHLEDRLWPMQRAGDGWFEIMLPGIAAGTRYGFVLPDGRLVPDPASRWQEGDVHSRSKVADADAYAWRNAHWQGRPWREAVICELHVGTFTPEGTFAAAAQKLGDLAELGFTAIELMPVGQFPGNRGWGYDGVLTYAPHGAYGTPDELKRFVDEAHGHGLMVLLDVVYNHFGPEGNYLSSYASAFFDADRHTPWGSAIAYQRRPVRDFFIGNALYWLGEFRFDGLRLDAIDQIRDPSEPELLIELAERVRSAMPTRHIHLTTEDNRNVTHLHERRHGRVTHYTGEWNDDFHNAAHALLTGEGEGYYEDFADDPVGRLARSLAEGFAYQGEPSPHAGGKPRGKPSGHLPTTALVDFLQNHDQIGNRAFGERLTALTSREKLQALTTVLLLSPHIPLLFMGEQWGETRPFLFFTDYTGDLADAVRNGRRSEFAAFSAFSGDPERTSEIPDPNALETFEASRIAWDRRDSEEGRSWLALYRTLLAQRREHVVPLLGEDTAFAGKMLTRQRHAFAIDWSLQGGRLQLRANLGDGSGSVPGIDGEVIGSFGACDGGKDGGALALGPWSVLVAVSR